MYSLNDFTESTYRDGPTPMRTAYLPTAADLTPIYNTRAAQLYPIAGERPHPTKRDSNRLAHQRREMSAYRMLAQKEGHKVTMWQYLSSRVVRTECHECEAVLMLDFTSRDTVVTVADALDTPCMVLPS